MGLVSAARKALGGVIAKTGAALKLPEFGISEAVAGPPAPATAKTTTPEEGISIEAERLRAERERQDLEKSRSLPPAKVKSVKPAPPTSPPPTPQPGSQVDLTIPSVKEYVPSAEEAARTAAEEKARVQQEKMRRFGEVVEPLRADIETYLRGREPLTSLFQAQLKEQGVPEAKERLGVFEAEERKLGEQLKTLPGEEIARRKETGMLTAAAERRVRALEERPIREQLLKTSGAAGAERVGLNRAYELVNKYLDVLREQEKRQVEPLEYKLKTAEQRFGLEEEGFKGQIDSIASRLTGFNEDRKAKLEEYKTAVDAGIKLSLAQRREETDLKKLELQHLYKMEQIAAQNKGQRPREFEEVVAIKDQVVRDVESGQALLDALQEYSDNIDPNIIYYLYNQNSPYGPAQESEAQLMEWGISASRVPGGEGSLTVPYRAGGAP